MPLEAPLEPVAVRVAELNRRYRHHGATRILEDVLSDAQIGPIALVSSFGAEAVVLLHLLAQIDRSVPVIFLDTEMLFEETLSYQAEVADRLGLSDVRLVRPDREALFLRDPDAMLHRFDADGCCTLRKSEPLERALSGFDAWITGRKRFHGGGRAGLALFEDEDGRRIRVNPLATWSAQNVRDYMFNNRLPRHPMVSGGYASIGCVPCTTAVAPGEAPRAGRWRGQKKTECGIHARRGQAVAPPHETPREVRP